MGYCLKSTAHYMLWSWRFRLLSSVAAWTIPAAGGSDEFFPDDAACLEYVEGLRWPEGFVGLAKLGCHTV